MNIRLSTGYLLRQGWHLVAGSKNAVFMLLFTMTLLLTLLTTFGTAALGITLDTNNLSSGSLILGLIVQFIMSPFIAGGLMIGVKKARDGSKTSGFAHLHQWGLLGVASLGIALVQLVVQGIVVVLAVVSAHLHHVLLAKYILALGIAGWLFLVHVPWFVLTLILVADKMLSPVAALLNAFRLLFKHYGRIVFTLFLILLFNLIGGVVLFLAYAAVVGLQVPFLSNSVTIVFFSLWCISLIWTLPWGIMIWGVLYRHIVDHQPMTV